MVSVSTQPCGLPPNHMGIVTLPEKAGKTSVLSLPASPKTVPQITVMTVMKSSKAPATCQTMKLSALHEFFISYKNLEAGNIIIIIL